MANNLSVLIIDDEYGNNEKLQADFEHLTGIYNHVNVVRFESGQDAQGKNSYTKIASQVFEREWSLILLDLNFKSSAKTNLDFGAQVYVELKNRKPSLPVVMLTGEDALNLPSSLPDDVPYLSKEALGLIGEERKRFATVSLPEQERLAWRNWRNLVLYGFFLGTGPMAANHLSIDQKRMLLRMENKEITVSNIMLQTFFEVFRRADPFEKKNLLLLGETGTGKQVMAEYFYRMTQLYTGKTRQTSKTPLISQEITTVTNTIFESLLFGRKKGVAADARTDEPGLVDAAGEGVLFLDEIGDLNIESQNKLRRLLENRKYRWVGETQEREARCSFVFATNRDISESQHFKTDLYRRLGTPVVIPPLRDHAEDIVSLAKYFTDGKIAILPEACDRLQSFNFTDNVRELRNLMHNVCEKKSINGKIVAVDIENGLLEYSARKKCGAENAPILRPDDKTLDCYPIQTLSNLAQIMDSIQVDKNDSALEGGIIEIEDAYCRLLKRIHSASMKRFNNNNRAAILYMLGLQEGSSVNTIYTRARKHIEKDQLKYFMNQKNKAKIDVAQSEDLK